ncbi:MAG: hypothetical protein WKF88_04080 [Ferruginibacter sp.]
MNFLRIIFAVVFLTVSSGLSAQRTPVKVKKAIGYKVPKLTTSLGNFKDTMYITPTEALTVIGMPLKITDAKNNPYTVSSYQFAYRQIVTTEDEQTGKPSNSTSIKSSLFKNSPLPDLWLTTIRERIRPGEEYIFFAVIAKDAQGRVMYSPDLKLIVK